MAPSTIETGIYVPPNPPWGNVRAVTALARWGGLSSLFVWDHFQEFYPTVLWDETFTPFSDSVSSPHEVFDYQTLLGALAGRTGKMQLGVGVSEPIRRHPVLLAQAALTLAHLTRRAPILGLGCGEKMNTEPYGLSRRRAVDRLDEALRIVRRCLDSRGPFDFAGVHFHLDGALMDLQAPPGRTPKVWVAAHGPRMLEQTGRYGDGWLPMTIALNTPDEYAAKLARIRSAARGAGRDPDRIVPALFAYVLVAPTQKRAQAMLHSRMVRYWALLFSAEHWTAAGAVHPFGSQFRGSVDMLPEHYDRTTLEKALEAVPPEVAERGFLVGTPGRIAARLREFGDAGLRHVVVGPTSSYLSVQDWAFAAPGVHRIAALLRK
ncbi:LLM class flavin-dependent oxidoreductase [Rhodococcus indonesiensis]|uniref:LLM class flavin-dependent oxidoreductase n=1 Tax=Rhodococcus indonesiensis TaxID=3055869 RepID=UPI0039F72A4A